MIVPTGRGKEGFGPEWDFSPPFPHPHPPSAKAWGCQLQPEMGVEGGAGGRRGRYLKQDVAFFYLKVKIILMLLSNLVWESFSWISVLCGYVNGLQVQPQLSVFQTQSGSFYCC